MDRRIVHLDFPAFAVAVERVRDPGLRGRPLAVSPPGGGRALVQVASAEARRAGVARGMTAAEARRRCPGILLLPPDPVLYRRAERAVLGLLGEFSPRVEPARHGRAFIDLTGTGRLFGAPQDAAYRIQRELGARLRLEANAGVAANKLVSRIASRVVPPVGLCDVFPTTEADFLGPLEAAHLPAFAAGADRGLLVDLALRRVAEVRSVLLADLTAAFGRFGRVLYRESRGIDYAPVRTPEREAAVTEEETLPEETNDAEVLAAEMRRLLARAGRRLRAWGLVAGRAAVGVLFTDRMESARLVELRPPTALDRPLARALDPALLRLLERRKRVRFLQVRLTRLEPAGRQLSLFPASPAEAREEALTAAVDRIRDRFGPGAVRFGAEAA